MSILKKIRIILFSIGIYSFNLDKFWTDIVYKEKYIYIYIYMCVCVCEKTIYYEDVFVYLSYVTV